MKKSIFFLLGLLISFLFLVPFVHADDDCGYWSWGANRSVYCSEPAYSSYSGCSDNGYQMGLPTSSDYSGSTAFKYVSDLTGTLSDGSTVTYGQLYKQAYVYWTDVDCDSELCSVGDCITESTTCQNGSWDDDEEGIDCGGDCTDSCDSQSCYSGYTYYAAEDGDYCIASTDPDALGNCPDGYESYYETYGEYSETIDGDCITFDMSHNDGYSYPTSSTDEVELDDGSTVPSGFDVSVVTYSTDEVYTVSTDDDGNTTTTKTTTVTGSDGTSTTTTSTTTTDSDGNSTTSTTTTEEGTVEENYDNYDYDVEDYEDSYTGTYSDEDIPEESSLTDILDYFDVTEYTSIITDTKIEIASTYCANTFTYQGKDIDFGFCSDNATTLFAFMSPFILFSATVFALFILFSPKGG
jgi:hypothetical protein